MKLHNIGTIRTKDNTFMEFIIGALETSEEYHYLITVLDRPKQYVIDIFEADPNSPHKEKEVKFADIDPEVIRAPLTESSDSVNVQKFKPEDDNYIDLITTKYKDGESSQIFVRCPTCGHVYRTYLELNSCEEREIDPYIMTRTFICYKCGGEIHVKQRDR